jgi:GT2 family glycosyltransferase
MSKVSLAVLSVLYGQDEEQVRRLVRSVAASVKQASAAGSVSRSCLLLGNCGEPYLQEFVEQLGALSPQVRLVQFGENLGHSGGCNALAEEAAAGGSADVLLFLNPDALLAPSALPPLLADLAVDGVGAADGRQIPFEHPKYFDPKTREQSWGSGACLAARNEAYLQAGGFDETHFWSYCNDVDLSWRIRLQGWKLLHTPDAAVFHDKRIDKAGGIEPTETEVYFATLGRLNLARRYARPDVEQKTLRWIHSHGSDAHQRAAGAFQSEVAAGKAPDPIADASSVAVFSKGEYGDRRF